jgi:AraC family transcriptional regulator, melibiose operon regulatory protein
MHLEKISLFDLQLVSLNVEPVAAAYYFKTWNGYDMVHDHTHDTIEIMYVINGYCRIYVNDKAKNLAKNEFIIIDIGVPHRLVVDDNVNCRMLNIEFKFLNSRYDVGLNQLDYAVLKDYEELLYTLRDLVLEHQDALRNNQAAKLILFRYLFIKLARLWEKKQSTGDNCASGYVRKSLEFIHHNYDRRIKISDIASFVNVNSNYLQRIFKKQKSQTIIEYLTCLRMEKAKLLLKNTDISVTDITEYIGINSRQYFSYLFRKYYGISPTELRKKSEYLTSIE